MIKLKSSKIENSSQSHYPHYPHEVVLQWNYIYYESVGSVQA